MPVSQIEFGHVRLNGLAPTHLKELSPGAAPILKPEAKRLAKSVSVGLMNNLSEDDLIYPRVL